MGSPTVSRGRGSLLLRGRQRLGRAMHHVPVSLLVLILATLLFVADHATNGTHHAVSTLARYRAGAMFGSPWQLPLSALLPQSGLQWIWTIVAGGTLFVAVELRLGRIRAAAVLALSHVVPTVAVACWTYAAGDAAGLHREDFGTSCLIMGAAGALIVLRQSRLLLAAVVVTFAVDAFVNSPTTIVEHLIAVAVGGSTAATAQWWRARRVCPARGREAGGATHAWHLGAEADAAARERSRVTASAVPVSHRTRAGVSWSVARLITLRGRSGATQTPMHRISAVRVRHGE